MVSFYLHLSLVLLLDYIGDSGVAVHAMRPPEKRKLRNGITAYDVNKIAHEAEEIIRSSMST
jgi:hypothetical protein